MKNQVKKKRYKKNNFFFSLLLIIYLLMIFNGVWLLSSYSKIDQINIYNTNELNDEQIAMSLNIDEQTTPLELYREWPELEERIKQVSPQVLSASISLHPLRQLNVVIDEGKLLALWQRGDRYYPVLKTGDFLERVTLERAPLLPILKTQKNPKDIQSILEDLDAMDDHTRQMIVLIQDVKSNKQDVKLQMNDGQTVLGKWDTIFKKMNYYPEMRTVIGNKKGVLHLETGAYFKEDNGVTTYDLIDQE